jgi:hypothetical protein
MERRHFFRSPMMRRPSDVLSEALAPLGVRDEHAPAVARAAEQ